MKLVRLQLVIMAKKNPREWEKAKQLIQGIIEAVDKLGQLEKAYLVIPMGDCSILVYVFVSNVATNAIMFYASSNFTCALTGGLLHSPNLIMAHPAECT